MRRSLLLGFALAGAMLASNSRADARDCAYYGTNGPSVYNGREGFDDGFRKMLDDVGFGSIRVGFRIDTEQAWNQKLFDQYDKIIEKARERGVEVMGLVLYESLRGGQAEWNGPGSAAYVQKFVDVTKILFARYGDTIKHWEIWNEPNACSSDYFATCLANAQSAGVYFLRPEVFAKILAETWIQNRALIQKEGLHLVMGGLYAHDVDGGPYAAADYMNQVYQLGPWDYMKANYGRRYPWDYFGFHIYTTLNGAMPGSTISSYLNQIAAVRASHGDASPIWMTEFGWRTAQISEALQSQNLMTEMGVLESRADVDRTFVFRVTEYDTWGIHRANGTRKPAADAFDARIGRCTYPARTLPAQVTGNEAISVVNWPGDRHVEVLATTTNGDLVRTVSAKDGTYAPLTRIDGGSSCGSTAVYWPPKGNYAEVVTIASDGTSKHAWEKPAWNALSDFGGTGLSHLSSIAWTDGHVEIFGRGSAGDVLHKHWDFATNAWSAWETLGGSFATGASPIMWGDGHVELFAIDAKGVASHAWSGAFPGGWHAWEVMKNDPGVVLASRITPVRLANGKVVAFARTAAGHLAAAVYDGKTPGWSTFHEADSATTIFGEPSAAFSSRADVPGVVVVARDPKGNVLAMQPDADGKGTFAPLGDAVAVSDPLAWARADGTLDVYAVAADGALLVRHRDGAGAWNAWTSIRGATGAPPLRACSAPLPEGPKAPDDDLPRPGDDAQPGDGARDGDAPAASDDASSAAGCGCRAAAHGPRAAAILGVAFATALAARRRRRFTSRR